MKQPRLAQVEPGSVSQTHGPCFFLPTISSWKQALRARVSPISGLGRGPPRLPADKGNSQLLLGVLVRTRAHTHRHTHTLLRAVLCLLFVCPQEAGYTSLCLASSNLRGRTGLCVCQAPGPGLEWPRSLQPAPFAKGELQGGTVGTLGPWRLPLGDGGGVLREWAGQPAEL